MNIRKLDDDFSVTAQITPEQVRSHELVRLLVSDLLTMQDPPPSGLRDLAGRLTVRN